MNAGLSRVHIEDQTVYALVLEPDKFLPAAGQGAIAIETRRKDRLAMELLSGINHAETQARVTAEREFLRVIGAGCQTPIGARTWVKGAELHMAVRVFSEHYTFAPPLELNDKSSIYAPKALGSRLAAIAKSRV